MLDGEVVSEILKASTPFLKVDDWRASWLVRYTALVKLRGVVKTRGFVFSVKQI